MRTFASVAGIVAVAALLSGCSLAQLASMAGVPTPPVITPPPTVVPPVKVAGDVNGDGKVSPGEAALAAYVPTIATAGGPSVTTLQLNGIQGYAASTSPAVAAVNTIGTFKVATITMAANGASLTVQVDGKTYVLPSSGPSQTAQMYKGGPNVTFYAFGAKPGTNGDTAFSYNQKYSSITVFGKDVVVGTQTTPASVGGFTLVATGAETPVANLPAQIATYKGGWGIALANGVAGASGEFTANANFGTKQLTWDVFESGQTSGTGTGTIDGNKFSGAFTNKFSQQAGLQAVGACLANCTWNGTGEVVGAFYGPGAEEMAGVISGNSVSTEGGTTAMSGFFLGTKN